jgi:hypothetical protein
MKPAKIRVPQDISELLEVTSSMLISAPKFLDRIGYFPWRNLDYVFQELHEGLNHNRSALGEERYHDLMRMSDQMRALFEADPEDKTGETLQGCKIIHEMEDILQQARRRGQRAKMGAFANFPYEIVEASGENALATWKELKNAGRGAPIVLGEDDLENLLFPFDPMHRARLEPIEEILAAADAINFPDDLYKRRRDAEAEAKVSFGQIASLADFDDKECEAPLGDWPAETSYGADLSVVHNAGAKRLKSTAPLR